jgi:hypothetical protein
MRACYKGTTLCKEITAYYMYCTSSDEKVAKGGTTGHTPLQRIAGQ